MNLQSAEIVALKALEWIVGNDELMPIFLGSTGIEAKSLAAGATDSVVLASVVDFILMNDNWVIEFASVAGIDPSQMLIVRAALPGGSAPDWT